MNPLVPHDPLLVAFDLTSLMRRHGVTIRELARRMGVTMARVREVRDAKRVHYLTRCDFHEAITGDVVFSRARWDAMQRRAAERAAEPRWWEID